VGNVGVGFVDQVSESDEFGFVFFRSGDEVFSGFVLGGVGVGDEFGDGIDEVLDWVSVSGSEFGHGQEDGTPGSGFLEFFNFGFGDLSFVSEGEGVGVNSNESDQANGKDLSHFY